MDNSYLSLDDLAKYIILSEDSKDNIGYNRYYINEDFSDMPSDISNNISNNTMSFTDIIYVTSRLTYIAD